MKHEGMGYIRGLEGLKKDSDLFRKKLAIVCIEGRAAYICGRLPSNRRFFEIGWIFDLLNL